jgi:hypothetical protein
MTAYTKSTNFATKDTLTSGDPLKIVKGTEINTEFDNIQTAVNSKSDTASPTFTGTVTAAALTTTGNTILGDASTDTLNVGNGGLVKDASGNVGIGASPSYRLDVNATSFIAASVSTSYSGAGNIRIADASTTSASAPYIGSVGNNLTFGRLGTAEYARIDSSGNLLVGKTASNGATVGCEMYGIGLGIFTRDSNSPMYINRLTNDGTLVEFAQATTTEGTISVSGTTVSYNGGHLSRYAQTQDAKDETLLKGTVLSNLDEMNVYTNNEGNAVANEQLNKVKMSDVEGDINVAGVFVNWSHDEAHNVDEINMAMTGDMIIRIAQGVTVQRGDLLISAGDGTAKPQGDDIRRSKTVAKVTSTHVTCTYADGSYCVPCVLMAC